MTAKNRLAPILPPRAVALSLPILDQFEPPEMRDAPAPEEADLPPFGPGDPFSPHKILNHFERLQKLVRGDLVYPITVEIDPTNVCNHRCQWCVSIQSHTGEELAADRFESLVAELQACDVRSVVLKGGGEPGAHPDFLRLLEVLREGGVSVGLITNGSFPRVGSVEAVLETCRWVRVSLDAATAQTHAQIHGSRDFGRILRNVEQLAGGAGKTVVGLNFVAEPRNHLEMADFARLGKAMGAVYVSIRCVFDPSSPMPAPMRDAMRASAIAAKREETREFRVFLGNFTDRYLTAAQADVFPYARCLGPNLVGVVGGDGEVYACCYLRGNKQFSFGNIHRQTFADLWSGPRRRQVMNAVYRGECGRACAGGMTANRYNTYNEILNYLACEEKQHAEFA